MTRFQLLLSMALCCAASAALSETGENTALGAIKLLPKGAAAKIALLEAREAKPAPDRWHILIHDPKEENGVHEYVVAGGEVVASRSLSQFAESLSAEDVFGDRSRSIPTGWQNSLNSMPRPITSCSSR